MKYLIKTAAYSYRPDDAVRGPFFLYADLPVAEQDTILAYWQEFTHASDRLSRLRGMQMQTTTTRTYDSGVLSELTPPQAAHLEADGWVALDADWAPRLLPRRAHAQYLKLLPNAFYFVNELYDRFVVVESWRLHYFTVFDASIQWGAMAPPWST